MKFTSHSQDEYGQHIGTRLCVQLGLMTQRWRGSWTGKFTLHCIGS